jgi:hypothetical protein
MGTVSMSIDNRLPAWVVNMGIILIVLMAAGLVVCILRDIAEMRVLWAMEKQAAGREKSRSDMKMPKMPIVKPSKETPSRRCRRHGVCLLETDLRYQAYRNRLPGRKAE